MSRTVRAPIPKDVLRARRQMKRNRVKLRYGQNEFYLTRYERKEKFDGYEKDADNGN